MELSTTAKSETKYKFSCFVRMGKSLAVLPVLPLGSCRCTRAPPTSPLQLLQPIFMWPFGSGDKDTAELAKELPQDLQLFFGAADPATRSGADSLKDEKVAEVLAKQPQGYSHEFAAYKRDELLKKAVAVNCAEIQQAVVACYQGWLLVSTNHCMDEIKRATRCTEVQQRALQRMRYADCYSRPQCQYMRTVVDRLFTENFGQYGERVDEEAEKAFNRGVDAAFERAWR